jgi:hypothetical protein
MPSGVEVTFVTLSTRVTLFWPGGRVFDSLWRGERNESVLGSRTGVPRRLYTTRRNTNGRTWSPLNLPGWGAFVITKTEPLW